MFVIRKVMEELQVSREGEKLSYYPGVTFSQHRDEFEDWWCTSQTQIELSNRGFLSRESKRRGNRPPCWSAHGAQQLAVKLAAQLAVLLAAQLAVQLAAQRMCESLGRPEQKPTPASHV